MGLRPAIGAARRADRVWGSVAGHTIPDVPLGPLIERDDLIDKVTAAVGDARNGAGGVLVLAGEAGAGKTVLLRQALRQVDPEAIWGYCEPLATPRPLGPFRDIARQLWPDEPPVTDSVFLPERLLHRLADRPAVLVIEDGHWIDTASADALRFLGRRLADTPCLLAVTTRTESGAGPLSVSLSELGAGVVQRLVVPPLSAAGVRGLVDAAGGHLDASEVSRLTGGNAFLVTELIAGPADGSGASLQSSVSARVTRLSSGSRDLVELLSVLPGRSAIGLLDPNWTDLDDAVGAGLIRVDGGDVVFRHELVRRAVEASLAPGRLRWLHRVVLERLATLDEPEPALLAHHAREADDLPLALRAEQDAGRRAARLGSHREAAEHARRAAGDAGRIAGTVTQARAWIECAQREAAIGHDSAAQEAAGRALRAAGLADDPGLTAAALREVSRYTLDEVESLRLATEAVAITSTLGDHREKAAALAHLSLIRMLARDLTQAIAVAQQAIELAVAIDDLPSELAASIALGSSWLVSGDPRGEPVLRRVIHLAARHGSDPDVGRAYANLVSGAGEARLYELSAAAHEEALRYFTARDLDGMAGYTRAWHARCLFEQGRWPQAEQLSAQVLADPLRASAITLLTANTVQVRLRVRRGEPDAAGPLDAAQRIADATGALQRVAPVVAARAEQAWLAGAPLPVDPLVAVYSVALRHESAWYTGEIGFWLDRAGWLPGGLPGSAAEPYRLHVLGDPAAAAQAWTALGCPYEAATAWSDTADEGLVRRAWDIFAELDARPARERAARRLRELGVLSVPRGPRTTTVDDPAGLTAREREVVSLVVEGLTDPEIAARLHLSVRTVGHHVSAVLRKTGVRSRRDLRV